MNYKIYKRLISENKEHIDDSKFVLGINIGSKFTTISMFKPKNGECEPIDHSGGYGSFAIPTVIQYIDETNEWVFGEGALLNAGAFSDITFYDIVDKLGNNEYIEVFGKIYTTYKILGMFISDIVSKCFEINPQGQIGGIIVCHPYYFTAAQLEELSKAFKYAGLEKEIISYENDYACIFSHYNKQLDFKAGNHILVIDYGYNEIRGNIFKIEDNEPPIKPCTTSLNHTLEKGDHPAQPKELSNKRCNSAIKSVVYKVNSIASGKAIDSKLLELFTLYFCNEFKTKPSMLTDDHMTKLSIFIHEHKNMLLSGKAKNVNLYFNFCYPPFQKSMSIETIERLINPFKQGFNKFVDELLKAGEREGIKKEEISAIIGVGGGFNMNFAKSVLTEYSKNVHISPKCQGVHSLGAALISAMKLTILEDTPFSFTDNHKINEDYGFMAISDKREKFITLFEKGSFWWNARGQLNFILDDTSEVPEISIFSRNNEGELIKKGTLFLDGIPKRPRKMTRITVQMGFKRYNVINVSVTDLGFGEFFPTEGIVISKEIMV